MPVTWRRYLTGIALLLGAGLFIGWLYNAAVVGLLIAALFALALNVRQLLRFERALMSDRLESVSFGDGLWSAIAARILFLRQRIRKHKRRHRRLLRDVRNSTNAMPDAGIVLNTELEIVLANRAAQALVGVRMPQDRGQRIDNILRAPAFVSYLDADDRELAVEIPSPLLEDGWLSCRLVPFGAEQWLLLIRDVTEAIRINKMRRDFVANASHELRSPLTVISGYLDTLAGDADMPADWHKPLQQMRSQAERMNRVVAELLELSRLENPDSARDDQEIDVAAMLALARRSWSGQPGVPAIDVDCKFAARLRGVPAEIESVITNLLSNAVRHTPADGQITLVYRANEAGGADIAVIDTGEGVAAEHIPRLTERFFRVDAGRSRDAGGVGLGLAIVKHALLRHDATLLVDSTPGKGSTFTCRFPPHRVVVPAPIPIQEAKKKAD